MPTKSSCPTCPFRFQPPNVFWHRLLLRSKTTSVACSGRGARSAEARAVSEALAEPGGSAAGAAAPRSRRGRAAVAPAGRPQHCRRILPPPPGRAGSLQGSPTQNASAQEHAGVPRHKEPRGSAGTAHPTGMQVGPHNPGQKDRLTSLSSLCISTLPSFHPLQIKTQRVINNLLGRNRSHLR